MSHRFTLVLILGTIAGCTAHGDGLVPNYQAIVTAIQEGGLSPDVNGKVVLPPDKHGLVISDTVYVTGSVQGSRQYLFATWQGKGSNVQGYLYCEGARPKIGQEIQVRCFDAGPRFVGMTNVEVERDIGSGWYFVYRSFD